jgi:hypothetical protein
MIGKNDKQCPNLGVAGQTFETGLGLRVGRMSGSGCSRSCARDGALS